MTQLLPVKAHGACASVPLGAAAAPAAVHAIGRATPARRFVLLAVDAVAPARTPPGAELDPRRVRALAARVRRGGVRQPIVVTTAAEPGRYEIVAGWARWAAARLAGLEVVPCLLDPDLGARRGRLLADAAEVLRRGDLGPLEQAALLATVMDVLGVDALEAGALLGWSYLQARRLMQLHGAPTVVRMALAAGRLDARAALELVRIHNRRARASPADDARPRPDLAALVARAADEGWTVRRLEAYARCGAADASAAPPHPSAAPGFRVSRGYLTVDTARVARGDLAPEERRRLAGVLEELLHAVKIETP
jgi:ParB family transcriptional regulator, chromosome partitioning protein